MQGKCNHKLQLGSVWGRCQSWKFWLAQYRFKHRRNGDNLWDFLLLKRDRDTVKQVDIKRNICENSRGNRGRKKNRTLNKNGQNDVINKYVRIQLKKISWDFSKPIVFIIFKITNELTNEKKKLLCYFTVKCSYFFSNTYRYKF